MLSVTNTEGPAFNTRSQTHQCLSPETSTSQPDITPEVSESEDHICQEPSQWIGYKLSCRCRKLTFSAKQYPNAYQMEKHLSMKLIILHV